MNEDQKKLNIAISGAGGYIGKSLINYFLDETDYPLILSYFDTESIPQSVLENKTRCKIVIGDLTNENVCNELLKNANVLIHLAQNVSPKINAGPWQNAYNYGCDSTLVMLDLLRKRTKPLHIIYPSSGGTVYSLGDSEEKLPFKENLVTKPVSPYGIQKIMFENHFSLLNSINPNISVNILRVSNPYGMPLPEERAQGFIGIATSKIKKNEIIDIWGNINSTRDYIHLNDLCKAFEVALDYKNGFQVFNIGSGKGTSLRQLIDLFSISLGREIKYRVLESESENYFPSWNVLDISKAQKELNWSPKINIKEGIKDAIKQI